MVVPAPRESALTCQGLVKRYGTVTAVNGLSFEVARGDCFGLLGPNGASKTTTLEIMEGLQEPDASIVEVFGKPWTAATRGALRGQLGVRLQQTELPDRLTVLETVRLFRSFYAQGVSVPELLRWTQLEEKWDARLSGLSDGQKQRLSLGCALAGEPALLFLDEPTTGLDPQARLAVWDVIERFIQRGGTVVISTHYMDEADRLCRRVAIVDHGAIIVAGSPAELKSQVASAQVLELELDQGALEAAQLRALPAVEHVTGSGRFWRLGCTAMGETMPALMQLLASNDERARNNGQG
jgi:ABC-2 type transport system ATP-binding protein